MTLHDHRGLFLHRSRDCRPAVSDAQHLPYEMSGVCIDRHRATCSHRLKAGASGPASKVEIYGHSGFPHGRFTRPSKCSDTSGFLLPTTTVVRLGGSTGVSRPDDC
jgi:hypothetical protein